MSGESDSSEKTEEPTQKRISEAEKKGQVAVSREVTNFFMLLVLALNIIWFAPYYAKEMVLVMSRFIHSPHDILVGDNNMGQFMSETMSEIAFLMTLPIIATIFAALFANFMQNGVIISSESLTPKLEKISVFKGLKRQFSLKSFIEFIKGLIKITIIGSVSYIVIASEAQRLEGLVAYSINDIIDLLMALSFKIVLSACSIMAVIAVLDYMYQRYEYIKSLKMSRQELKEEYKQTEGDPHIKGKLRQIRMEKAKNRMMAAVPDADVIIRNPTHYAIALKYDDATMTAPKVLAMGRDHIALTMIEIAEKHEIITVRNAPLARALYDTASIDGEIPLDHYQAVAEVIGYVYKVRGRK